MNHAEVYEERAVRFLDDELVGEEAADFEAHLAVCSDCTAMVDEHRDALRLVKAGLSGALVRPGITTGSIRRRAVARRTRVRYATFAAAGLVLAIAAFALLREPEVEQPASENALTEQDLELRVLELRIASLEAQLEQMQTETQRLAEWAAMEAEWSDRGLAAIALAAARHLEESGLDVEGARRQYQLVIDHFGETPEADTAREYLAAT